MLRLTASHGLVEDREEDYDESVQRMLGGLELWARRTGPGQTGPGRIGPGTALERPADLLALDVTERRSRPDDVALLLLHRTSPLPRHPAHTPHTSREVIRPPGAAGRFGGGPGRRFRGLVRPAVGGERVRIEAGLTRY